MRDRLCRCCHRHACRHQNCLRRSESTCLPCPWCCDRCAHDRAHGRGHDSHCCLRCDCRRRAAWTGSRGHSRCNRYDRTHSSTERISCGSTDGKHCTPRRRSSGSMRTARWSTCIATRDCSSFGSMRRMRRSDRRSSRGSGRTEKRTHTAQRIEAVRAAVRALCIVLLPGSSVCAFAVCPDVFHHAFQQSTACPSDDSDGAADQIVHGAVGNGEGTAGTGGERDANGGLSRTARLIAKRD